MEKFAIDNNWAAIRAALTAGGYAWEATSGRDPIDGFDRIGCTVRLNRCEILVQRAGGRRPDIRPRHGFDTQTEQRAAIAQIGAFLVNRGLATKYNR